MLASVLTLFFGRLACAWTYAAPAEATYTLKPVQCVATVSMLVVVLLAVRACPRYRVAFLAVPVTPARLPDCWPRGGTMQFAQMDPPAASAVCHLRSDPTDGVCYKDATHGGRTS